MAVSSNASAAATRDSALRGVRVIDFGHYLAAPLAGMLLADQGAEVIKVERPEGDPARHHPAFATWNRGKQSIVLDLKTPEGQAQAQALIRSADIVLENFRPGVAERLGIGYETVGAQHPGLIYCSFPGFGAGHPLREAQGWEPIVGASTGLYPAHTHTGNGTDNGPAPWFTPLPIASTYAAMLGVVCIMMALNARDKSQRGQRLEVPLYSAMFTAMGRHLVHFEHFEAPDNFAWPRSVMARQYECADGRYIQHHGMFERFVQQTLTAAGRPEWIAEAAPLFGHPVPAEAIAPWVERFSAMFRERPALEWQEAISAQGGACTVCKTIDEWLEHPHAVEANMVVEVDDARYGRMKQPGVQVKLRRTPGRVQGRAPGLGEHTHSILHTLDTSAQPPAPVPGAATLLSALQGVRVLDLCIILAGPTCGRTLAEFGAEVIKIDDPTRTGDAVGYLDVNRGKRSIELNLKTVAGRDIFWRLVDSADVIVENNRRHSLARLGLGYEDIRARKPSIVYASLNCYGYDGPWSERPGWEQVAQATSGIQVRHGGRDGAPMLLPYPVNDYGTGLMGTYAVALALHERNLSGLGQAVDSGLSLTAGLLQSPFFLDYAGFQRQELEGPAVRGWSAASRLYPTTDGWMYVHCATAAAWQAWLGLPAFTALQHYAGQYPDPRHPGQADEPIAKELNSIFATASSTRWIDMLRPHGISVVKNVTLTDYRHDAYVRQAGLIVNREHAGRGRADHLGTTAYLSGTPMRLGAPTPLPGGQTRDILHELGYTAAEIEQYVATGVVRAV